MVDHCEEVLHRLRLVKRTHWVNVETSEAKVGRWSLSEGCMNVEMDVRHLARVAFSAPPVGIAF